MNVRHLAARPLQRWIRFDWLKGYVMRSINIKPIRYTQEKLALLKLLALGNQEIEEGRVIPVAEVVRRLKTRKR